MSRNKKLKNEFQSTYGNKWENKTYFSQQDLDRFRDDLDVIFRRQGYNADNEVLGASLSNQFMIKPNPGKFIKWLGCARSWMDTVECDRFKQIHSIQDRLCTTFFYEGAIQYDLFNRPDHFNSSRVSASNRHSYFDTKQVVKFILDFNPSDYADLKRQIGSRIIFHSRQQVATQADTDYYVTRGYQYDFYISRSDTKRLSYPYNTHCRDYFAANIKQYQTDLDTSPRVELNRQSCLQNCIVRSAIEKCKCWPTLMPYYEDDELDPNRNLEVCRWASTSTFYNNNANKSKSTEATTVSGLHGGQTVNLTTHKYYDCYKVYHRRCEQLCPAECSTTQYLVLSERMKWPSDAELLFEDESAKLLRSCCALVTIKFIDFQHTVHQYVPKFNLVDLIGNVGGLLALWLGISIVSVYYTIEKLMKVLKERRRRKKRIQPHDIDKSLA